MTIRRQDNEQNEVTSPLTTPQPQYTPGSIDFEELNANRREDHDEGEDAIVKQESTASASTIKVQISTPADFSDIYYEIATIKSPYTFQARYIQFS